jgi:hypothetical protein
MILSVPNYHINDNIFDLDSGMSLIFALLQDHLQPNGIQLIEYLVKHHPQGRQMLEIVDQSGLPPFVVALERNKPQMAQTLLDLGTPINLMYPLHVSRLSAHKQKRLSVLNGPNLRWMTLLDSVYEHISKEEGSQGGPYTELAKKMRQMGAKSRIEIKLPKS